MTTLYATTYPNLDGDTVTTRAALEPVSESPVSDTTTEVLPALMSWQIRAGWTNSLETIVSHSRLRSSAMGNPAYLLNFVSGLSARTEANGSVGFVYGDYLLNRLLVVTYGRSGHVIALAVA